MNVVKFYIYAVKSCGERVYAFGWCRDAESGFARFRRDAARFGMAYAGIEAVPVAPNAFDAYKPIGPPVVAD